MNLVKKKIRLYRDDGLGCFQNMSGPQLERIKKKICKIFENFGLEITIENNLQITDFLNVTFDLKNGKYYSYRKPNSERLYTHRLSNHPENIIKEIPNMISKKISEISCEKHEFEKAKEVNNEALEKTGYNQKLKYQNQHANRSSRKRKIIWFNRPYSKHVKTNIEKIFIKLISKTLS